MKLAHIKRKTLTKYSITTKEAKVLKLLSYKPKYINRMKTAHLESTLTRPVLLIDEAQEAPAAVLNELRLLSSAEFDSRNLLSVVLAGDKRLLNKLRHDDLLPLGSRIRTRLTTDYASREELMACLQHLLTSAGNAHLMSNELMTMLCEHAIGNYRVFTSMAAKLLSAAAEQELTHLDEKLYFQCFATPTRHTNS